MDDLRKDIKEIRESQIRMEADLKYHIKRTDLLEVDVQKRSNALELEIERMDAHIEKLSKPMPLGDILKIAATITALVSSTLALLKYFKGL